MRPRISENGFSPPRVKSSPAIYALITSGSFPRANSGKYPKITIVTTDRRTRATALRSRVGVGSYGRATKTAVGDSRPNVPARTDGSAARELRKRAPGASFALPSRALCRSIRLVETYEKDSYLVRLRFREKRYTTKSEKVGKGNLKNSGGTRLGRRPLYGGIEG